jgi:hypothetical protein
MTTKISYGGYRFPPEIIQQAIWLYVRFTLSFRDIVDLLAERGDLAVYESVRRWVNHFGPMIAADLRTQRGCWITLPASVNRARARCLSSAIAANSLAGFSTGPGLG